jgi:hypothetical protein
MSEYLDTLTGREPEFWAEVEDLIATKQAKSYDLAIQHLADLRDLAMRQGGEAGFAKRLVALRDAHTRKSAFIARLREKGF